MDFTIFQQLGISLALGTLIGLEREHRHQTGHFDITGGIRTFALTSLTGTLTYLLSVYSMALFIVITAGFLGLLLAGYILTTKRSGGAGMTSEIASILVYIIGVLSGMQRYLLATFVAVIVLLILLFRDPLHTWAKRLQNKELISTLEFMIIAFIVLPLLPNKSYGPYEFFNPYLIWLMVVFISGISFLSYIAIKLLGARKGITATGFLAGFISSTALAFSFSAESKKNKEIINPYVLAVVVASTAMFFRVILEIAVLNRDLIKLLLVPLLTMGIVGILATLFTWWKSRKIPEIIGKDVLKLKSPFSLLPALKFGIFFALILFLSKFATATVGTHGLYLTSIFSGLVDVDAITVSMANLAKTDISKDSAVLAITIATMVNTLVKGGIFIIFGNIKAALKVIKVFSLILISGGVSLLFI